MSRENTANMCKRFRREEICMLRWYYWRPSRNGLSRQMTFFKAGMTTTRSPSELTLRMRHELSLRRWYEYNSALLTKETRIIFMTLCHNMLFWLLVPARFECYPVAHRLPSAWQDFKRMLIIIGLFVATASLSGGHVARLNTTSFGFEMMICHPAHRW